MMADVAYRDRSTDEEEPVELSSDEIRILIVAKAEGLAKRVDIGSGFTNADVDWAITTTRRILDLLLKLPGESLTEML